MEYQNYGDINYSGSLWNNLKESAKETGGTGE